MARNKKQSNSGTRSGVAESPRDAIIANETPILEGRCDDSVSGVGEEVGGFPVKLINPRSQVFRPYGDAGELFQKEIIALKDFDINWLTITRMTVPSIDVPAIHKTPYCGFPVDAGDEFSVQLSDGRLIKANN